MRVQPVSGPHAISPVNTTNNSNSRSAAIAAFEKASTPPQQAQENPVLNPNKVSPEELSAVNTPRQELTDNSSETPNSSDNSTISEPQEETQAPPKDTPESRRWAQLARTERQLRAKALQQEAAIKAREAAIQAREDAIAAKDKEYSTGYYRKDSIKQDPLQALADAGVSYDELTQQLLNQQPTDPRILNTINELKNEIKSLKAGNEEIRKTYDQQQVDTREAAVRQIAVDVKNLVKHDPNYETVRATNSINDVVELITKTYDQDNVLLTVEEAAQEVENYLIEEALKITRIGKIQQRLQQAQAKQAAAGAKTPAKQAATTERPTMKTLTNAHSGTRKLSARERAMLAFKGEKF